jgi:hypothetical protein
MTNISHFIRQLARSAVLSAFTLAAVATVADARADDDNTGAAAAEPAGTPVEYTELEQRIGDTVIVETTLNTIRRGMLVKYTNPTLTLRLSPDQGGFDLTVPRETIRSLRVIPAPPVRTIIEVQSAETN